MEVATSIHYQKCEQKSSQVDTEEQCETFFDPTTGKKVRQVKVSKKQANKVTLLSEQWQILQKARIDKLQEMLKQDHIVHRANSDFFLTYQSDVTNTLCLFERCRVKLKLDYDEKSPRSVWSDPHMASWFLFGLSSDKLGEVPENLALTPHLSCLWTWAEMLEFGKKPRFVEHYLRQRPDVPKAESLFLVTPIMMSFYLLGCLLHQHIPELAELIRKPILDHMHSENFPRFHKLHIPVNDELPTCAVFQYTFTLQCPRLEIPETLGEYCSPDDKAILSVDGSLALLFAHESIRRAIWKQFEKLAITEEPPIDVRPTGRLIQAFLGE